MGWYIIGSRGEQISDSVFSVEPAASFPSILRVCVRIRSGADGHDGDGDGDGDCDGDGEGDVMVTVMVLVPKALSPVGWLRQRQSQSFN
jgi:hypothetical protein